MIVVFQRAWTIATRRDEPICGWDDQFGGISRVKGEGCVGIELDSLGWGTYHRELVGLRDLWLMTLCTAHCSSLLIQWRDISGGRTVLVEIYGRIGRATS